MNLLLRKYSLDFPLKSGVVRISSNVRKNIKRGKAIKITSENGSIIRELVKTNFKEAKSFIDMDYDSRVQLGVTDFYGREVELKLKQVSKLLLYWSHPDHGLRLGFQLGVVGLVLGIISLIVTFHPSIIPTTRVIGLIDRSYTDTSVADKASPIIERGSK